MAIAEVLPTAIVVLTLSANDVGAICASHDLCMLTLAWQVVPTAAKPMNNENSCFAQENWQYQSKFYFAGWHVRRA